MLYCMVRQIITGKEIGTEYKLTKLKVVVSYK